MLRRQLKQKRPLKTYKKAYEFYKKTCGTIKEVKVLVEGLRKFLSLPRFQELAKETDYLKRGEETAVKMMEAVMTATESELETMKSTIKTFEAIGSVEQLNKVLAICEEFAALGTPKALAHRLNRAAKIETALLEGRRKAAAKKIAKTLGVNEKVAFDLLKRMPVKEVISNLKGLKESVKLQDNYKVKPQASKPSQTVKTQSSQSFGEKYFDVWSKKADQFAAVSAQQALTAHR